MLEDKEMLLAPGARQREGDRVHILLAAIVAEGSQVLRVALARDNIYLRLSVGQKTRSQGSGIIAFHFTNSNDQLLD